MTGYTSLLEKRNFNIKEWLEKDLIFAMGISAIFRDSDTSKWNVEALKKNLSKDFDEDIQRVENEIKKSKDTIEVLKNKSLKDFIKEQKLTIKKDIEYHKKALVNDQEKAKQYHVVINRLVNLQSNPKFQDELLQGVLKFGIEQAVSTLDFDYTGTYHSDQLRVLQKQLDFTQEEWESEKRVEILREENYIEKQYDRLQEVKDRKEERMKLCENYIEAMNSLNTI